MKNLIYQCYTGPLDSKVKNSISSFKEYAKLVSAEYRFDHNPEIIPQTHWYSAWYNSLNPISDPSFQKYDKILYVDTDVITNYDCVEIPNIFDIEIEDIGMVRHALPSYFAQGVSNEYFYHIKNKSNNLWEEIIYKEFMVELQKDNLFFKNIYFSSGVVVYSNQGLYNLYNSKISFDEYVNTILKHKDLDTYFAMPERYLITLASVAGCLIEELHNNWNYQVIDCFNKNLNLRTRHFIDSSFKSDFKITNERVPLIQEPGTRIRAEEYSYFIHERENNWRRIFDS